MHDTALALRHTAASCADDSAPTPVEDRVVLHVGCGAYAPEKLPTAFRAPGWRELRLDIDPDVRPDLIASITEMTAVSDLSVDAVYSSHNIEHLYPHDVPLALGEMRRVLKPGGIAVIKAPDLQEVAQHVAEGLLEEPLYYSGMGPIAALDILYGHRASMTAGNIFMAHRTGFTSSSLAAALIHAGFAAAILQRGGFALTAIAFPVHPSDEQLAAVQKQQLYIPSQPATLFVPTA